MDKPLTKPVFEARRLGFFVSFGCVACSGSVDDTEVGPDPPEEIVTSVDTPSADVIGVSATGGPDAWTVSVTVRSDDLGCEQYADWWEILSADEALIYRRVLRHSHSGEQPFTRASESPVEVDGDVNLYVRAHLSPGGYVGTVFGGTLNEGFIQVSLPLGFGSGLEDLAPQPEGCLY